MAGRVLGAVVLAALVASGVWADTMVAANRRISSPTPFLVAGEEVFAPLTPALQMLGARAEITPDAVRITTAANQEILISRTRPEATRDGVLRELPGPPRMRGGALLLPAKAVGSLLGCAVRWDEATRTLYLHHWVRKFSLEALPDRYRLTVAAEGPMSYEAGRLENPPRLYLDLKYVDLADIPLEAATESSYLRRARISQRALAPAPEGDVTRVVVELSEWQPHRVSMSPDRRELHVDLPRAIGAPLPPEAPPVVLSGMSFRRISARLAEVTLSTFGTAVCESGATDEPPAVWVELANAESQIEPSRLTVEDRLVSEVSVEPLSDRPRGQRVTISLAEPVGHFVSTSRGAVRVLLGRSDMADLKIVVDPGHGGHDTGAIGRSGLLEKEVNLDIALRARRMLAAMGATVRMTRTDDAPCVPWNRGNREEQRQELRSRCAVSDDWGADLFVSVHANAREANPQSVRGTETYYRKEDSRAFAEVMQQEMVRALGLPDGGTKYHPKPIIVLYQPRAPSVLVEVGYLSNAQDEQELAKPEFRERAAQGIVNGVKRWALEGNLLPRLAVRERPAGDDRGEQVEERPVSEAGPRE